MRRTLFVGHNLQALNDSIEYFLQIRPMDINRFYQIWRTIEPEMNEDISESCQGNSIVAKSKLTAEIPQGSLLAGYTLAQKLIQFGMDPQEMTATRRRHYYQLFVILNYKHEGYSREETAKKVIEWAMNERQHGRSNSTEQEIISDVQSDVKGIYDDNKHFPAMICDEVRVSQLDIAYVRNIKNETTRKIVWCIIILGRMFNNQGQFFFSIRQIGAITGCKKSTVHARVKELMKNEQLMLMQRGSYYKQQASSYYMRILEEYHPDTTLPSGSSTFQGVFEDTYKLVDRENERYERSLL